MERQARSSRQDEMNRDNTASMKQRRDACMQIRVPCKGSEMARAEGGGGGGGACFVIAPCTHLWRSDEFSPGESPSWICTQQACSLTSAVAIGCTGDGRRRYTRFDVFLCGRRRLRRSAAPREECARENSGAVGARQFHAETLRLRCRASTGGSGSAAYAGGGTPYRFLNVIYRHAVHPAKRLLPALLATRSPFQCPDGVAKTLEVDSTSIPERTANLDI
jgi:hypothetical protein